jgi:glycerol-3-phosphate acyltransferase PlsX
MGGDQAPRVVVEGVVEASSLLNQGEELILVGDEGAIKKEMEDLPAGSLLISVVHASESIYMDESPILALRKKKDSSIAVALAMQQKGEVEAVVSAGNTGAVMASSVWKLKKLEGVDRPAIASFFPTEKDPIIVLDVGANADCKPLNLYQFAVMGSIYAQSILGRRNPRVGLLSIGEESSKGNELTLETYRFLEKSSLNFVGNLEGKDVLTGDVDVVVCDGFVGNVILKFTESIERILTTHFNKHLRSNLRSKLGAFLLKPVFENFRKDFDYAEYGGALLLGVDGVSIICHGKSSPKAISNAILMARRMVKEEINERIKERLKENEVGKRNNG